MDSDSEATLLTSRQLLDGVFSDIRLFSILEQVDPADSKELDRAHLQNYLKDNAKIHDSETVAKSFDSRAPVRAMRLKTPVTLLRLYGGESMATGRYYFYCVWRAASVFDSAFGLDHDDTILTGYTGWSDASGLATPPGNLAYHLSTTEIPAGTEVIIGTVADNFADKLGLAKVGGNIQIFIPHVRSFPYEVYQLEMNHSPLSLRPAPSWARNVSAREIVVQSDDRILRFRR
jgi:hypothetical protein